MTYWLVQELCGLYLVGICVTYYVAKFNGRNAILGAVLGALFPLVSLVVYLILGQNEGHQLDMKEYMERVHKEREDLAELQHQLEIQAHPDKK